METYFRSPIKSGLFLAAPVTLHWWVHSYGHDSSMVCTHLVTCYFHVEKGCVYFQSLNRQSKSLLTEWIFILIPSYLHHILKHWPVWMISLVTVMLHLFMWSLRIVSLLCTFLELFFRLWLCLMLKLFKKAFISGLTIVSSRLFTGGFLLSMSDSEYL